MSQQKRKPRTGIDRAFEQYDFPDKTLPRGRKPAGGNYKKKQQAKAKWNNATPSFDQRMKQIGLPRL